MMDSLSMQRIALRVSLQKTMLKLESIPGLRNFSRNID